MPVNIAGFDKRDSQGKSAGGNRLAMLVVCLGCAVLAVSLTSCGGALSVEREPQLTKEGVLATRYSIVCVIHGDGDYLYHDTGGNEHAADEEALAGAMRVGQQNPCAEVFIFYQRPERHFLFFFPLHDGEFYCYRNGRLVAQEAYWRDLGESHFAAETELYRRFLPENQRDLARVFLYCGHEIPEFDGAGYDASYPDRSFTVQCLADGLRGFAGQSGKFDLVILATCFGGTPYTIGTLGAFARYIVASPDNLHLSYFGFQALERLDLSVRDGDVHALAERVARRAFDRLLREVQTAVSVVVYDGDRVREFLDSVREIYRQTVITLKDEGPASMTRLEHCDCADVSAYVRPTMSEGVEVLYRPARFGRSKDKQHHSGWECWRERGPEAAASQIPESVLKQIGRLNDAAGEMSNSVQLPDPGTAVNR